MAYRRFEMFEIRQIIQRLRMGESARQIARSQHVGRATVESIHCIALTQNWLDPLSQIPEDTTQGTTERFECRAISGGDSEVARPGNQCHNHTTGAASEAWL